MKTIIFVITLLVYFSYSSHAQTSCDVVEVYQGVRPEYGVKVLTKYDEVEELSDVVEMIFSSVTLNQGKYQVEITRKGSNLYEIIGQDLFIETRYCYEYATYDDAILVIESQYGYNRGSLIFLE